MTTRFVEALIEALVISESGLTDYGLEGLEKIQDPYQRRLWLQDEKLLRRIGGGSGRLVYDLEDGYVLKIAYGSDGPDQNKSEVEISQELGATGFFPKILSFDPKYTWLIMQKAKVWKSEGDFFASTGLPDNFLDNFCNAAAFVPPTEAGYRSIYNKMSKQPELKEVFDSANDLGKKILKMLFVLTAKYHIDDIGRFDHIGLLKNGNVVVVDYGLRLE